MEKQKQLYFYRDITNNETLFSCEKKNESDYKKIKIVCEENADNKHIPNFEMFDEGMLITIGKSLHVNNSLNHIEKVVMQHLCAVKEWNLKEKTKRGFPAVISLSSAEIPKGETNFYVCCSEHGVYKVTQNFPSCSYAVPAVMFLSNDASQYLVRFPDLPEVVGSGKTKEEAFENAKTELKYALFCSDNASVVPSELESVKQKYPSAFMIEV